MVELIEHETVVCDLTQERTHGQVGWCYRACQDIAEALIAAGWRGTVHGSAVGAIAMSNLRARAT
jgi:hypothetical protein